ncbi:DsbA family protein [Microbacterium halotolerans]|uniref:DsbA family protein n=1 Tax=Microbacterium halotolerans TaxID=246613 RepID=UPI000E6AAD39|nr:DsbA family protein [Microbacterium halotolerans]
MQSVKLTYAFDALCGWCYGFGPALHEFADSNADRIELDVRSGGLFSGEATGPISACPHIPAANERIARLTGVPFGAPYQRLLAEGTAVMDSTAAATGLVALRSQAPGRALEFAAAIQAAWYQQGQDLRDQAVYQEIAARCGLDVPAVTEAYASPSTRIAAERDFQYVRSLGVTRYPTLLVHTASGVQPLGGPVSRADALTSVLDSYLNRNTEPVRASESIRPDGFP